MKCYDCKSRIPCHERFDDELEEGRSAVVLRKNPADEQHVIDSSLSFHPECFNWERAKEFLGR